MKLQYAITALANYFKLKCLSTNFLYRSNHIFISFYDYVFVITYVVTTPHVTTHPNDTSAAAPFGAEFKCSFETYGYLTVTWYRNNAYPVPEKAYSTLILSVNITTSILTIPNVTSEDVGTYYCVAEIGRVAVKSQSAKLFLAGKIVTFVVLCVIYRTL